MDKARILLVDDDAAVTRSVGRVLEVLGGFVVRTERDGTRTLEVAREFRPDLILLDVLADRWDGGQVAASLESDPELGATPVAFLTGLVDRDEVAVEQTDSRGRRLIPKALEPAELVDIVRELLAGRILREWDRSATDRGRQALARLVVGMSGTAHQPLTDEQLAALVDHHLWPDFKLAVAAALAELREAWPTQPRLQEDRRGPTGSAS
jgi:CheY-like chemotaxis protein